MKAPCEFASRLAILGVVVVIIAQWSGFVFTGVAITNFMVAWGVVSLCHAVEWHDKQRRN